MNSENQDLNRSEEQKGQAADAGATQNEQRQPEPQSGQEEAQPLGNVAGGVIGAAVGGLVGGRVGAVVGAAVGAVAASALRGENPIEKAKETIGGVKEAISGAGARLEATAGEVQGAVAGATASFDEKKKETIDAVKAASSSVGAKLEAAKEDIHEAVAEASSGLEASAAPSSEQAEPSKTNDAIEGGEHDRQASGIQGTTPEVSNLVEAAYVQALEMEKPAGNQPSAQ